MEMVFAVGRSNSAQASGWAVERMDSRARSLNYQQSLWKVRLKVICQVNWSRGGLASVNAGAVACYCVCVSLCLLWIFQDFPFVICRLLTTFESDFPSRAMVYLCALMRIYGFSHLNARAPAFKRWTLTQMRSRSLASKNNLKILYGFLKEDSQLNANELFHRGHSINRRRLSHSSIISSLVFGYFLFTVLSRNVLMEIKLDSFFHRYCDLRFKLHENTQQRFLSRSLYLFWFVYVCLCYALILALDGNW